MQTRTLYALLATALMLPLGSAFAQETSESTNSPSPVDAVTYKLTISPAEQHAAPGSSATYRVQLEARSEKVVHLTLRAPEGAATLSADEIAIGLGKPGSAALTILAPSPNATERDAIVVVVVAKDENGETHDAKAVLFFRPKTTERPTTQPAERPLLAPEATRAPANEPMPRPSIDAYELRAAALERRLTALLERIDRQLARLDPTTARSPPVVLPIPMRMTLSERDITVPEDGGRVALLVQAGERGGRVPLHVRVDDATGWRIAPEQDFVQLAPHQRTWLWIEIMPGHTRSVEFAIVAGETGNGPVARGFAHAEGPRPITGEPAPPAEPAQPIAATEAESPTPAEPVATA